MTDGRLRIVVAEGADKPRGLLRFVLEGEGFEVAAEVATRAELVRAVASEQPDAVVLDHAIGQGAIAMARAAAPSTKVILVAPAEPADVEVDGWVDLSEILRELGSTVVRVCAPERLQATGSVTETYVRPDWIDRVRKDPATLREILTTGPASIVTPRPSVTELQRQSAEHVHPSVLRRRLRPAAAAAGSDASIGGRGQAKEPTPVVGAHEPTLRIVEDEPLVILPDLDAHPAESSDTSAVPPADHTSTEEPRRVGRIAIGAAAVAAALVLGLALGGTRHAPILMADAPGIPAISHGTGDFQHRPVDKDRGPHTGSGGSDHRVRGSGGSGGSPSGPVAGTGGGAQPDGSTKPGDGGGSQPGGTGGTPDPGPGQHPPGNANGWVHKPPHGGWHGTKPKGSSHEPSAGRPAHEPHGTPKVRHAR